MFQATHLIGFGSKRPAAGGGVTTLIDRTSGTIIGDMTSNGGNAASFDGTTVQVLTSCSRSAGSTPRGYVGKDWNGVGGGTKIITKYVVYSPDDLGFDGNAGHTVTISLYGSNSTPSAWTGTDFGGTLLATTSGISCATDVIHTKTSGITTTTAYRYHWLQVTPNTGNNEMYYAEIEFYEDI